MDFATVIGFLAGVAAIIISIMSSDSLMAFVDIPSVFITVGGGLAATFASYRVSEIGKILKVVAKAFVGKSIDPGETIRQLVELSMKARREGILSLDSDNEEIKNDFLRQALQLVVDGVEPDIIRETLDLELENLNIRHQRGQSIFKTMATQFPAWGMIGTLIGLIILLRSLDDPSKIGPSMAVALVTTFYGSVLANLICNPIANKLAMKSKEEIRQKEMIIEGILSIQAGENPRIMEIKLKTFLSPEQKRRYEEMSNQVSENKAREVKTV